MVKNFILFILFCILVGVDVEFGNYVIGGGLLNGSIISILLISGLIMFVNYVLLLGMYRTFKNKELK